jgi:hypothetical protein
MHLTEINSFTFDYIFEFLQLHKNSEPKIIHPPIKPNANLNEVMEEADA